MRRNLNILVELRSEAVEVAPNRDASRLVQHSAAHAGSDPSAVTVADIQPNDSSQWPQIADGGNVSQLWLARDRTHSPLQHMARLILMGAGPRILRVAATETPMDCG
jgi:hypothetical protein